MPREQGDDDRNAGTGSGRSPAVAETRRKTGTEEDCAMRWTLIMTGGTEYRTNSSDGKEFSRQGQEENPWRNSPIADIDDT
jgi:hypothetical protein